MPIMPALGRLRQEGQCKTEVKLGLYNKAVNLRIARTSMISCVERRGGKGSALESIEFSVRLAKALPPNCVALTSLNFVFLICKMTKCQVELLGRPGTE